MIMFCLGQSILNNKFELRFNNFHSLWWALNLAWSSDPSACMPVGLDFVGSHVVQQW
jgi:hypothetical protein